MGEVRQHVLLQGVVHLSEICNVVLLAMQLLAPEQGEILGGWSKENQFQMGYRIVAAMSRSTLPVLLLT
jgi:hypothetical protein